MFVKDGIRIGIVVLGGALAACSSMKEKPAAPVTASESPAVTPAELNSEPDLEKMAKERAAQRQAAEAEIPAHLLYEAGWPVCMPTPAEARHLASVRRRVAEAVSLQLQCTDAEAVSARYGELIQRKAQRLAVPA